jgi:hypothetical protein
VEEDRMAEQGNDHRNLVATSPYLAKPGHVFQLRAKSKNARCGWEVVPRRKADKNRVLRCGIRGCKLWAVMVNHHWPVFNTYTLCHKHDVALRPKKVRR